MGMIKNQGLKRLKKEDLQYKIGQPKKHVKPKAKKSSFVLNLDDESDLISEKEYLSAVKGIKNLYRKMIPRTLIFREVLLTEKVDEEFNINKLLH